MLSIDKWFKITTYPENEEFLERKLKEFDLVIDQKSYSRVNPAWEHKFTNKIVRVHFTCHASQETFDEVVDYLRNDFESWASILH